MALTGDRVKGHAAVATGIATHFVESEKIPALEEELQSVKTREVRLWHTCLKIVSHVVQSSEIDGILAKYTSDINSLPATAFDKNRDSIRSCFGHSTVEEVVSAVDELAKSGDEWAAKLLAMLQSRSPTSMKVRLMKPLAMTDCTCPQHPKQGARKPARSPTAHSPSDGRLCVKCTVDRATQSRFPYNRLPWLTPVVVFYAMCT